MKKLIGVLLAVIVVAGGLGGFVYAQTAEHQPVGGQKLVGFGALGMDTGAIPPTVFYTRFVITNPDCVGQVENIRISIVKDDGTEYQGQLMRPGESSSFSTLRPHESGVIDLASCVAPEQNDPNAWPLGAFTVEVSWTSTKGGLPLTGWSWMATARFENGTWVDTHLTSAVSNMVNMAQVLTKGK